jgi:uncharacterized protein YjiK
VGIERLEAAMVRLEERAQWNVDDVGTLREATGGRINADETAWFRELLRKKWKRFSEPARRAVELLAWEAAPDLQRTKLRYAGKFSTGIDEQSAITFVSPKIGFMLVDDESSVVWRLLVPDRNERRHALKPEQFRKDKGDMHGLEGTAYDAGTRSLLTVSEDERHVYEMKLAGGAPGKPKKLGKLANVANEDNKGWEGITVLPAEFCDDKRSRIVAVHEGSPLAIGIFNRETLEREAVIELPEAMDPMPADLSDLTFDPKTGRFFLLSDESRLIWEIDLRRVPEFLRPRPMQFQWAMVPIASMKIRGEAGKDPQPEGITVDHRGDLWVSCERGTALLRFTRG